MKKEWKDIEGYKVRIDVGSSLSEAMSSSMDAAVICFTTDGHIVLNGISYIVSTTEFESLKTDVESWGQIISDNQQSVRTLRDDVDTLKTQMEDAINCIGELQENDKKHDKRLDELYVIVDDLSPRVVDLETFRETATNDIDFLKRQDTAHSAIENAHAARIESLETSYQSIPSIYATKENLSTVGKMANEAQKSSQANSQFIFDHEDRISALEKGGGGGSSDSALKARVAELEAQMDAIKKLLTMA